MNGNHFYVIFIFYATAYVCVPFNTQNAVKIKEIIVHCYIAYV